MLEALTALLKLPDGLVELNKLFKAKGLAEADPKEVAAVLKVIASMTDIKEPGKG